MVLKRKLPTQTAKGDDKPDSNEQNDTNKTQEPWVFSGGEKSETPKQDNKSVPWSVESDNKKVEPTTETPVKSSAVSDGDYPWSVNPANKTDSWKIENDTPTDNNTSGEKPPLAPSNDIYAGIGKEKAKQAKKQTAGAPPWQNSESSGGSGTPPILPTSVGGGQGGIMKSIMMLLIIGGVLVGGYIALFQKRDEVAEVTARWTGTLNEISQKIESSNDADPKPEDIISFGLGTGKIPETLKKEVKKEEQKEVKTTENKPIKKDKVTPKKIANTKVDFVDVDKKEQKEPIVADEKTEIPEDLSLFASLQAAIMKEKELKRTEDMAKISSNDPTVDPDTLSDKEKIIIGQKLRKQTNKQMNDYIKTLVEIKNPALKPKPGKFFEDFEKNARKSVTTSKNKGYSYKSNPKNLPIIPEPVVPVKPGVRTLADFGDDIFEIPRDKVRIPRKLNPRMGAYSFPSLEILSLVPHKGIIAFANGKEGILMIGEQIEGWELTSVRNEYAEFHNGKRKHVISIDIIR